MSKNVITLFFLRDTQYREELRTQVAITQIMIIFYHCVSIVIVSQLDWTQNHFWDPQNHCHQHGSDLVSIGIIFYQVPPSQVEKKLALAETRRRQHELSRTLSLSEANR